MENQVNEFVKMKDFGIRDWKQNLKNMTERITVKEKDGCAD